MTRVQRNLINTFITYLEVHKIKKSKHRHLHLNLSNSIIFFQEILLRIQCIKMIISTYVLTYKKPLIGPLHYTFKSSYFYLYNETNISYPAHL